MDDGIVLLANVAMMQFRSPCVARFRFFLLIRWGKVIRSSKNRLPPQRTNPGFMKHGIGALRPLRRPLPLSSLQHLAASLGVRIIELSDSLMQPLAIFRRKLLQPIVIGGKPFKDIERSKRAIGKRRYFSHEEWGR